MRVLFDTSVLIAAMVEKHPAHTRCVGWLKRARQREFTFLVSAHSLAEAYSVLSTLPTKPRISPGAAWRLVHENIENHAECINLSATDYFSILRQGSDIGLSGGVMFDSLIAKAAEKAQADKLLTLNAHDYERLWPEIRSLITSP